LKSPIQSITSSSQKNVVTQKTPFPLRKHAQEHAQQNSSKNKKRQTTNQTVKQQAPQNNGRRKTLKTTEPASTATCFVCVRAILLSAKFRFRHSRLCLYIVFVIYTPM
jgi:hypothetical protein